MNIAIYYSVHVCRDTMVQYCSTFVSIHFNMDAVAGCDATYQMF